MAGTEPHGGTGACAPLVLGFCPYFAAENTEASFYGDITGQTQTTTSQFVVCSLHSNRTDSWAGAPGMVGLRCARAGVTEARLTPATGSTVHRLEARVTAKAGGRAKWV